MTNILKKPIYQNKKTNNLYFGSVGVLSPPEHISDTGQNKTPDIFVGCLLKQNYQDVLVGCLLK